MNATADAANSIAIGGNASGGATFVETGATNGIAIGNQSRINANSGNSAAVGFNNSVTGTGSGAFGDNNTINANNAIAVGNANTVNGDSAMAIGNGAQANFANSAAIGNGATVARANQQTFGTASNTYTMAGVTSAASKTAQSGLTQLVTSDGGGNLATTTLSGLGLASTADLGAINSQLASLQTQITDNQQEARAGTALALASSRLNFDMRPGKFSVAAAMGYFKGEAGLAAGLGYAVTDRLRMNAAFSGAPQIDGYGASIGMSVTLN